MLTVDTEVKISKIEGLGVFSKENIPKGHVIWKYDKRYDLSWRSNEFEMLPEVVKNHIVHYGYQNKTTLNYILSLDNSIFFNHSKTPNTTEIYDSESEEGLTVVSRDIKPGEELTADYETYDKLIEEKLNG